MWKQSICIWSYKSLMQNLLNSFRTNSYIYICVSVCFCYDCFGQSESTMQDGPKTLSSSRRQSIPTTVNKWEPWVKAQPAEHARFSARGKDLSQMIMWLLNTVWTWTADRQGFPASYVQVRTEVRRKHAKQGQWSKTSRNGKPTI